MFGEMTVSDNLLSAYKYAFTNDRFYFNIQIIGYGKLFCIVYKSYSLAAVVLFNEHEQFTENLAEIAAVNLIDDEEIITFGIFFGFITAEPIEHVLFQLK